MLLSSDSPAGVTKSMGLGVIGFADALTELKPDLMLVLGDRYEIFFCLCRSNYRSGPDSSSSWW